MLSGCREPAAKGNQDFAVRALEWLRGSRRERAWTGAAGTLMDDPPMSKDDAASTSRVARTMWGLAVLTALGLCGLAWWGAGQREFRRSARAAFPTTAGAIAMQGLAGRVDVTRDARGVPHIEAEFESDAWSALGFAHAQDRLAQLLWLRRLARGRTAEVVGERGLPADRLARTLGIGMHADAEALRLDPETRRVLDAYSAGINSRMERIRAGLVAPPLHIAAESDLVEPWTPADSIAIVKLMAWSAGPAVETAAVLWDLIDRLGAVAARPFMPTGLGVRGADMSAKLPPSQRSGAVSGIESGVDGVHGAESGEAVGSTESGFRPLLSGSAGGTTLGDTYLNSTAWVVSGRRTQSGAPILAVAFHLPPTVPSLVYQAQLRSGDFEVAGATVPAVPSPQGSRP